MITLKAEKRNPNVKAKKLRREGYVTGILSGKEMKEPVALQFNGAEAAKFIKANKEGTQIYLDIEGEKVDALVKNIDYNPIEKQLMALDFQALVAGEKVSTTVAIKLEHTDMVQGIVEQEIEEVHYKADPANLLDTIVIDFDGYPADVRDIHVKDLPIPEGKQVHFITPEDAVVVQSGIGKVNMAICTQILVNIYGVDMLINTGVAGGLYKDINVGDIVISSDALQHDFDVTGLGYKKSVIPGMETSVFTADTELVEMAKEACEIVNPEIQCFVGRVVTGDQFISDNGTKAALVKDYDGYCAEMEGASMAQVATLNKIPFVIIRAISDKADNSAPVAYETFEEQAIVHTVKLLAAMFLKMSK